ncbi:type II toxin-antitoxin system VapC family toxin [Moraxella lacunata]|uniref:PIN domain-containing protein n=2 Tax=Moraxella lacunata TaxID=477 RepID=A0A1V4GUM3_MORLA|nr:type II toxin-antitoxin system VapC family toxin [Moraxella lacunata]OPH36031.1 hypothetical protein B5J94_08085 [Moraxella lacunata]
MMYLIDTNIIIYHLANMPQAVNFLDKHRGNLAISTITVSEVLSFDMNDDDLTATKTFLQDNFIWLDVSREIIFKSADIRRIKKTKTPDAIIGATAICHDLILVSRNEKDFMHLPIDFVNPMA